LKNTIQSERACESKRREKKMSTSTEEAEKTIRVIPFSGEHDAWRMWSRRFLARARMRGYKEVLLGSFISNFISSHGCRPDSW